MATIITHAFAASALSVAAPKTIPRARLAIVIGVLAILPDLDVIGFHFGIAYADPLGHRGFTHSILFALLVASIMPVIVFRPLLIHRRAYWILFGFAFAAILSHGILDAFTDAGLGVGFFIPFDNHRYFAPWRPISTSPLSISAFIDGHALRILVNEFQYIGLPLTGVLGCVHVIRRFRSGDDA